MRYEWASIITPTTFQIWHKNYTLDWKRPPGLDKIVFIELNNDYQCVIEDVPDRQLKCFYYDGPAIHFNLLSNTEKSTEDFIAKNVSHVSCVSELKFCCWVVHINKNSECSGIQSEQYSSMRKYVTKFKQTDADYLARQIEFQDNTFMDCRQSENFLTTCLITNNKGKWILPGRDQETKDIIIRNNTICVIPFHTSAHCRTINQDNKDFTFLDVPLKLRNNVRQIEGTQQNTFCYIDNEYTFNCYNPIVFKKPAKIPRELFDVYRLELERYTSNIDFAVGVIDFASWDDSQCILYKNLEVSCRDFAHAPFSYKNHIKKLNDNLIFKKVLNEQKAKLGLEIQEEDLEGNNSEYSSSKDGDQEIRRRSSRGKEKESEMINDDRDDKGVKRKSLTPRDYDSCEDILDEKCTRKSPRITSKINKEDSVISGSSSQEQDWQSDLSDNATRDASLESEDHKYLDNPSNQYQHLIDKQKVYHKERDEEDVKYTLNLDKLVLISFTNFLSSMEILEYSLVIFDLKSNKFEDKIQQLINPKNLSNIDEQLKSRTDITKEQMNKSDNWETVQTNANKWLDDKLKDVNWVFITNGYYDLKIVLPEQLNKQKDLPYHDQYNKYINIQDIFIQDLQFRKTEQLKKLDSAEMQSWWFKFNSDFTTIMLKYFEITPIIIQERNDLNMNLVRICQELNNAKINFKNQIKSIKNISDIDDQDENGEKGHPPQNTRRFNKIIS